MVDYWQNHPQTYTLCNTLQRTTHIAHLARARAISVTTNQPDLMPSLANLCDFIYRRAVLIVNSLPFLVSLMTGRSMRPSSSLWMINAGLIKLIAVCMVLLLVLVEFDAFDNVIQGFVTPYFFGVAVSLEGVGFPAWLNVHCYSLVRFDTKQNRREASLPCLSLRVLSNTFGRSSPITCRQPWATWWSGLGSSYQDCTTAWAMLQPYPLACLSSSWQA